MPNVSDTSNTEKRKTMKLPINIIKNSCMDTAIVGMGFADAFLIWWSKTFLQYIHIIYNIHTQLNTGRGCYNTCMDSCWFWWFVIQKE